MIFSDYELFHDKHMLDVLAKGTTTYEKFVADIDTLQMEQKERLKDEIRDMFRQNIPQPIAVTMQCRIMCKKERKEEMFNLLTEIGKEFENGKYRYHYKYEAPYWIITKIKKGAEYEKGKRN